MKILSTLILCSVIVSIKTSQPDVLGCGGFIKSHVPIDYSKVEVKLFTKQGILKDKTSCAPNNGYYFVPLYDKGDYILQLVPPPGWSFKPTKVHVTVDGVSDLCSRGKDINFVFEGFGITGKVNSLGAEDGPAGVTVELVSASSEKRTTLTTDKGHFAFTPIYPGSYVVSISHPKWKILKSSISVTVAEANTELLAKSLVVQGYDVSGVVKSDGNPVKNTQILLFSKNNDTSGYVEGCDKSSLSEHMSKYIVCHAESNEDGIYTFGTVPIGKYYVIPYYKKQNIYFEPELIEFEVGHGSTALSKPFEIIGFSVTGRVTRIENDSPIKDAVVFLNGTKVATTDGNGLYKLEKLRVGTYNIIVEASGLTFQEVPLRLDPSVQQIPDIIPHLYQVCGTVTSDKIETVSFINIKTKAHYSKETDKSNGQFCIMVPAGKYEVHVEVEDSNKKKDGLQFFPVLLTVDVPKDSVNKITFSQMKATVMGEVLCIREKDCADIKVSIKSLSTHFDEITVPVVDNKYSFEGITLGNYKFTLHSSKLCWKESEIEITVGSAKVELPPFLQVGYSVIFVSSHETKVVYKVPTKADLSSLNIDKGRSLHCVDKPGNYIFQLTGCHTYEFDKIPFNTDSGLNEIFLNAIKHENTLDVKAEENYGDLSVTTIAGSSTKVISPLLFKDGRYSLKLILAPGESITIEPKSEVMYFDPKTVSIVGSGDCKNLGTIFTAKKGKVFKGKVKPALPGVMIKIEDAETISVIAESETDKQGFYKFPPLDDTKEYNIKASKESFVLVGPDNNGDFSARKLAEVVVEVLDENDKSPLQGALLSLSGGESYRSNLQTNAIGKIIFTSLNPGEYFLRPMMKEYSFVPQSKIIDVKEGETVQVTLIGKRVAYSAYGVITSLTGDPEKNVAIIAEGINTCSHFSEESVSEASGQFRIRGLQPNCSYNIRVKITAGEPNAVERSTPKFIYIKDVVDDIKGLRMIVFRPVAKTDVLVRIYSENPEYYKSLKLKVAQASTPYNAIHATKIDTSSVKIRPDNNPGILVHVPLPIDGNSYIVQLDSSLPNSKLDSQTENFVVNSSFNYANFNFSVKMSVGEHQMKQTSVWALAFIFAIIFAVYNINVIMQILKRRVSSTLDSANLLNVKKSTVTEHVIDNTDIDKIVESINAPKRKIKPKKA